MPESSRAEGVTPLLPKTAVLPLLGEIIPLGNIYKPSEKIILEIMQLVQLKRIIISIILLGLAGGVAFFAVSETKAFVAKRESALNEKIGLLTVQVASLQTAVQKLSGESVETALSLKELQNRKEAIAKSQDELLTGAVANITPSVVSIVVSKDVPKLEVEYVNPFGDDPFFRNFNYQVPVYRQKGTVNQKVGAGTGFIVSPDGYILTNRHVVSDPNATYTALLSDGTQKNGRVIFRDSEHDLAVVKIEGGPFKPSPLGNSGSLKLGQTVVAVGNALGEYNNSVSVGIISGLNRTIEAGSGQSRETLAGVIQTDAAINPGNSGGPLITTTGEVIGVNVATVIGSSNISFSIPINTAKSLVNTYIR
ncbi:MAG: Protease DegQ [Parcubacteria group bacterium GW2011_GWA2_49_9]|nr:MAG: Protease DegQ [Parcubacteria group bacterium GW2011_GWA2_49_9]